MRKAFTLIELLVVIAIIAILAAILFPVFAQAKSAAKKTAFISNFKQSGMAMIMYAHDNEDNLPSSYSPNGDQGELWFDSAATIPAGWADPSTLYLEKEDIFQWGNAIQPYAKNYEVYEAPGMPMEDPGILAIPGKKRSRGGYSMNGLMSLYNLGSVASPSSAILLWGDDRRNWDGWLWAAPFMLCDGKEVCRYRGSTNCAQADQTSCSNGVGFISDMWGDTSPWYYGKTTVFLYADSSAKSRTLGHKIGAPAVPQSPTHRTDPYRYYLADGTGRSAYYCGPLLIECIFMPDRDPNQ